MKKILYVLFIALLICSCKKNKEELSTARSKIENSESKEIQSVGTEISEQNQIEQNEPQIVDFDDSKYNDNTTIEFALRNSNTDAVFCLYHNIRKINEINLENYISIGNWCKKTMNDITVTWNYENGAILGLETESDIYETRRGAKIGDSISKVMSLYEDDSDVYKWDYDTKSYYEINNREENKFTLLYANEGISLNAGNYIDEEMMTILFYCVDGKVNKIEIKSGN